MTNQDVVDFIRVKIAQTGDLLHTAELLMDYCLADNVEFVGIGCDNMTIVIVALLHGKTMDQWVADIRADVQATGLSDKYFFVDENAETGTLCF
jgi:protein phosphatase 2C family protein 2/3